jgi:hypothetical protein
MDVHFRVYATHDMHFGDGLSVIFLHDVEHVLEAEFPSFLPMRIEPGIGTELAGEHADIGGFDVEVPVVIGGISVTGFPDGIGQGTQEAR